MSTPEVNDAITSALQSFGQGNQQAALDTLRPLADMDERAAVLLMAWFLSQMGQPHWTDGLNYARRGVELGMPQIAQYYFGNMINDPNYRSQLPDLIQGAIAAGWPLDPLPNAPQAMQQGDPATALRLVQVSTTPRPYPDAWEGLLEEARTSFETLRTAATDVSEQQKRALEAIAESENRVNDRQAEVEQRAHSLLDLIERLTSAQATSYFDDEATAYSGEARGLWFGGLAVVVMAAVVALVPLAIYYFQRTTGRDSWIEGTELSWVHTAFVLALGAVAGVLLARARGRDRLRQRNRDLSVALQTMFVYSEQIQDPAERQTFIRDMGRTVLEAFLRQEPAVDSDRSLIAAIRGQ